MRVPRQGAIRKKVDVTTNEWRFAQESIVLAFLECDGLPSLWYWATLTMI
jgi:hypothetical protein